MTLLLWSALSVPLPGRCVQKLRFPRCLTPLCPLLSCLSWAWTPAWSRLRRNESAAGRGGAGSPGQWREVRQAQAPWGGTGSSRVSCSGETQCSIGSWQPGGRRQGGECVGRYWKSRKRGRRGETERQPGRGATRAEEPWLGQRAQAGWWQGKWVGEEQGCEEGKWAGGRAGFGRQVSPRKWARGRRRVSGRGAAGLERGGLRGAAPGAGAAPPGPWGSPGAAVPGRAMRGEAAADPIKDWAGGRRGKSGAAAASEMGMLNLPGFLSCGKKKVRRRGEAPGQVCENVGKCGCTWADVRECRQVWMHLSRWVVEVPRWAYRHSGAGTSAAMGRWDPDRWW